MKKDDLLASLRSRLPELQGSAEGDLKGGYAIVADADNGSDISSVSSDTNCSDNNSCSNNAECKDNTSCDHNVTCSNNKGCRHDTHCFNQVGEKAGYADDLLSFGSAL
jgi:hypothetical protein